MKDLERLAAACTEELKAIGISPGRVRSWSVNSRAKSRWGQCRKIAEGVFDINISERLLEDGADETAARTTIIHELLHTVDGCLGHKGKWKLLAELVGREYPQYRIKRTSSCEEKGQAALAGQGKYRITCTGCGAVAYRQRASKLIQRPGEFRCGRCGGTLKVEIRRFS